MKSLAHAAGTDVSLSASSELWFETPGVRALESLLMAAVESAAGSHGAFLFVWDSAGKSMAPVNRSAPGALDRAEAIRGKLSDLSAGEAVTLHGLTDTGESLLLPMVGLSGLEGVLLVEPTPAEGALEQLRGLCNFGAFLLNGLRRHQQTKTALAEALHDLATPLVSCRGYAKLAMSEKSTLSDTQYGYLSKILENLERMVQAVGNLRRAGVEE